MQKKFVLSVCSWSRQRLPRFLSCSNIQSRRSTMQSWQSSCVSHFTRIQMVGLFMPQPLVQRLLKMHDTKLFQKRHDACRMRRAWCKQKKSLCLVWNTMFRGCSKIPFVLYRQVEEWTFQLWTLHVSKSLVRFGYERGKGLLVWSLVWNFDFEAAPTQYVVRDSQQYTIVEWKALTFVEYKLIHWLPSSKNFPNWDPESWDETALWKCPTPNWTLCSPPDLETSGTKHLFARTSWSVKVSTWRS